MVFGFIAEKQKDPWVEWSPMLLFTLDEKDQMNHYHCYQWNPFLSK